MDINLPPGVDPDIDIQEVDPINQKRSLAFINHFILRTITFLNTFASTCESRFTDFEIKLRKIEASVCILESKLSSIPELNDTPVVTSQPEEINTKKDVLEQHPEDETPKSVVDGNVSNVSENIKTDDNEKPVENGIRIKDDPTYSKYFKMLHFGVQEEAVRLKMQAEGLDPNILNEPNKIVPRVEVNTNSIEDDSDSGASSD
ncbi:WASH complex subunit 3 [Chrysoperla carnea]|uniref:WASH complex subunit 3 n=1 Tax=Chrysoperla carnea TaxID=189513 RepID=UPI001D090665|nr:WASH complex subunit 3 [Chrysoperla carnea]